jgi:hypothetical protein
LSGPSPGFTTARMQKNRALPQVCGVSGNIFKMNLFSIRQRWTAAPAQQK